MQFVIMRILLAAFAFSSVEAKALPSSVEEFYKEKTITIYVGSSPGGAYDIYGRFLAKYLGRHMPGNPNVIVNNMPGAGSRTAAGYVANVAARDGTVVAVVDQALPLQQALGESLKFDNRTLNWIGNFVESPNVILTWTASGVTTIAEAQTREVPLGGSGSGSSQQAVLINEVLGTKFKIIEGYPGASQLDVALERGEIWARTSGWTSVKATKQDWLREKKVSILVQIGLRASADLPGVPLLMDLAKNEQDRQLLKLASVSASIGKPLMAGPQVPFERIEALRAGFDAALSDPEAIADADRIHLVLLPLSGRELAKMVDGVFETPEPLREKLAHMLGSMWK